MKNVRELEDNFNSNANMKGKDEEDPDDPLSSKDIVIKLRSFFVRRTNIYLEETNGQIRCLESSMCKLQKPLKKA